jgi:lysyl-tRNA synthetase class 2
LHQVIGKEEIEYQSQKINFTAPWRRIAFYESLEKMGNVPAEVLADPAKAIQFSQANNIVITKQDDLEQILTKIFDQLVEPQLVQPTFVYGYPTKISPLSRRNDQNPDITDRFELFIAGNEIANAFTELNDPIDQRGRFEHQVALREAGDEEAQFMDIDYVTAMEYGLPPTGGEGIGIDRVVMLLTDSTSIRDVIFFPHMRLKQD